MSLFVRDAMGRLIPVNPGLPARQGNQGGMGAILSEAELMRSLPDADIAGAIGPGVSPGGEQAVGARRVKLEAADNPPPAPTFRPLGGAQQNNRGQIRIVTLGTFAGSAPQRIASVVETSKNSGDDAETLNVQLGIDLPPELENLALVYSSTPIDVTALLEWGIGGAFFTAELDWTRGTTFCVSASFARISALVGAVPAILQPDLTMVLRASLAYGNSMGVSISSLARRTVPFTLLNMFPAASITIPIPPWALGFTIVDGGQVGGGVGPPDYSIFVTDGTVTQALYKLTSRTNVALQMEGQFPIPGKGRFITLVNNLGVATVAPKAIFNLSF